ncbi:MAG: D-alanine--(R)-lactate ligase, partial [Clostridia bacterium]|nr:D-alanine--(R)-lactate ligase [Clostridia bacterium]
MLKNVLVIFGGASSEYEVSLRSAASVLSNIDREKYN